MKFRFLESVPVVPQLLRQSDNGGERSSQLVADRGHEFVFGAHEVLQLSRSLNLLRHVAQNGREPGNLAGGVVMGESHRRHRHGRTIRRLEIELSGPCLSLLESRDDLFDQEVHGLTVECL